MSEVGLEHLEPEGYLQPRRYRIHYMCARCGHEWSRTTTKLDGKDPPCPVRACRDAALEEEIERRAENLALMLAERRAPAQVGNNVTNRAIDTTADIVMTDNHLTDIKDNIREGEAMAPKLPAPMQRMADGMFTGGALADRYGTRQARKMHLLGQRAIAGSFRSMSVNPAQVIPGSTGQPALRKVEG